MVITLGPGKEYLGLGSQYLATMLVVGTIHSARSATRQAPNSLTMVVCREMYCFWFQGESSMWVVVAYCLFVMRLLRCMGRTETVFSVDSLIHGLHVYRYVES